MEGTAQRVVILGAGGFAREVLDIFGACNANGARYDVLGFLDENAAHWGMELNGYPVLGGFEWLQREDAQGVRAICGVGNPAVRRRLVRKATERGIPFTNVVHPTAVLTPFVTFGEGVVVTAGCIFTNQIRIGDHVHVNLDCTIGHDAVIHDFCTLAPGVHVSGNVTIHQGCDIGTGTAIIQGVTVGEWTIIGAGAVVAHDLPANVTAVGVPAKVIKERPAGWQDT